MVELAQGNLLAADVEALVNAVNCVGIMGRGIALQLKQVFPENFSSYEAACKRREVRTGQVLVFETSRAANPKFVINFPTKQHWREASRTEYIDAGLKSLIDVVRARRIQSIAVPALGCGLGGLDWRDVQGRIMNAFADLPSVRVLLFEPAADFQTNRPGTARKQAMYKKHR